MKNNLLIVAIFCIGLGLRLYPALTQAPWLDEIYSLYFANNFSALKLIFQPPEAHPGAYYLLLKILLNFSTNLFLLRTITSIIPVLIGSYLIYRQTKSTFLLAVLLLNPFFIHMSWQLRMYGLTFMFSVLLIQLFLNSSPFNHKKFLLLSLLSTLFSFSLIIPVFCLYLYQYSREKNIKNLLYFTLIPLEFFITKGFFTYKKYVEYAAWINSPSFTNIPNTILTSLGFGTDINNLTSSTFFVALLFFLIFIPLVYLLSKRNKLFFYTFTLPLLITIAISASFPFLSQRFFFYHFIPKVSLFIPRFLLPLSLYFYLFLLQSFNKKHQKLLLFVLIIFWLNPNLILNLNSYYAKASPHNYPSNILVMPPWENLRLNSNFTRQDLNKISQDFDTASIIETDLTRISENPDCTSSAKFNNFVYLIDPRVKSISPYHQQMQQLLTLCYQRPLQNQLPKPSR